MKKHIAYYLLAMLGICSCMACTADADEVTTEDAQTVSPTSTAARSASVSHDGGHTYTTEELWCQRDGLRIYGVAGNIAPISYSERMVQLYASAELKRIEGAGHGFYGSQQTQAVQWTLDFLNQEEEKVVDEAGRQTDEDDTTGIRPVTM